MLLTQDPDSDPGASKLLGEIAPRNFVALLESIAEAGRGSGTPSQHNGLLATVMHTTVEQLWVWADVDDVAAYLAVPKNVKDLVDKLNVSIHMAGVMCSNSTDQHRMLIWPCIAMEHGSAQVHHLLHHAILTMGLIRCLLIWKHPKLAAAQEVLADALAMPPPMRADLWLQNRLQHQLETGEPYYGPIIMNLVGIVDNCSVMAPKAAHIAVSLLSLLVSRRPDATLGILDPDPLAEALYKYLADVAKMVCNPCCPVHNWFGVADLINALPLLYHLGDWSEAAAVLTSCTLPNGISALAINLCHTAGHEDSNHFDCEVDYAKYPECHRIVIAVSEIVEAAGEDAVAALRKKPVSFAAAAVAEVMGRWQFRGVPISSMRNPSEPSKAVAAKLSPREIAEYTEPISDTFVEYLPRWRKLAEATPALAYVVPIVEALAANRKPPLPAADTGLLRRPLHRVGMRCSLLSCGASTKADGGGDLLRCSGGCQGLARYCCSEHQLQHWPIHKQFCKRQPGKK